MGQIVETRKCHRWRRSTYIWTLISLAVVIALVYWEQAALLYVLSTLAVCILLLLVTFADLEGTKTESDKKSDSDRTQTTESDGITHASDPLSDSQTIKRHKGAA